MTLTFAIYPIEVFVITIGTSQKVDWKWELVINIGVYTNLFVQNKRYIKLI